MYYSHFDSPVGKLLLVGDGENIHRIDFPTTYRAVGSANGRNPVSIVIPCHRVIGTNGTLTGYAGGDSTKQWLLSHEAGEQSLFPFDE